MPTTRYCDPRISRTHREAVAFSCKRELSNEIVAGGCS